MYPQTVPRHARHRLGVYPSVFLPAQMTTVQVLDELTKEAVVGARLLDKMGQRIAVTDQMGYCRLELPQVGDTWLAIHHVGYQSDTVALSRSEQPGILLYLRPLTLAPVLIEAVPLAVSPEIGKNDGAHTALSPDAILDGGARCALSLRLYCLVSLSALRRVVDYGCGRQPRSDLGLIGWRTGV